MNPITTTWNKEELKTYALIFCAHADFNESKVEMRFIKEKYPSTHFDSIHNEYSKDSDFTRIEKIKNTVERLAFSTKEVEVLKEEIKNLYKADGKVDIQEENILRGLAHLF